MSAAMARMADLCTQLRGVAYSGGEAVSAPESGYLPILRANNITDGGLLLDDLTYVPKERISVKQLLRKGDVVIAASSGSLSVVGKAAPALTDMNAGFGAFCKVLRPNAKVAPSYFAHFFKTQDYRRRISALAAGANINNLRNEHLDDLVIPLPPLPEQRRIAAILDQAETLRTRRRIALAQLDSLAQSIFLDMFGDPVTNPFELPVLRGDQVCSRITVGIVVQPSSYYRDGGVPALRSLNIRPNKVVMKNLVYFSPEDNETKLAKTRVRKGDVLLVRTGQPGTAAVVPAELDGINAIDILIATPDASKVLADYLCFFFNSEAGKQMVLGAQRGQVQQHLNVGSLNAALIPIPPLPLQRTFATRIKAIEALKASHRAALAELDALFASLQHRAFSGELTRPVSSAATAVTAQVRSFEELQRLDAEVGLEALIFVARRMPEHDFYKTLKALYFADKRHLERHGRLIYGETHCALKMGPVPQAAYDAAKVLNGELLVSNFPDDALRAALRRTEKQLIPLRDADFGKLGSAERESLEWAIRYCAEMSFEQVKTASHDTAYDRTPKNAPIAIEDMIRMLPQDVQRRFFGQPPA